MNLGDMTVEVLTPAFTKVERNDDPTGNPTFTIHTRSMPGNAKVEVALAKTDATTITDIEKATIKATATRENNGDYSVTFQKTAFEPNTEYYLWFRYGAPDSDWAYQKVTNRPTYTFGNTTSGGESGGTGTEGGSESGGGNTTEGSQAGA